MEKFLTCIYYCSDLNIEGKSYSNNDIIKLLKYYNIESADIKKFRVLYRNINRIFDNYIKSRFENSTKKTRIEFLRLKKIYNKSYYDYINYQLPKELNEWVNKEINKINRIQKQNSISR